MPCCTTAGASAVYGADDVRPVPDETGRTRQPPVPVIKIMAQTCG
ncbi:hypothetical protein [Chlorogloea sp. CCALA 695]|nr:hypothetical protein [Chlorogloea sp. CCALA 695]